MNNVFLIYPSVLLSLFLSLGTTGRQAVPQGQPIQSSAAKPAAPIATQRKHRLHDSMLGLASWYGSMWQGRQTASGEAFDANKLTASHHTLPFGSLVRVTNLRNGLSVVVRINDRGTLAPGRIIDLSYAAAAQLHMREAGVARVQLDRIDPATIADNDPVAAPSTIR